MQMLKKNQGVLMAAKQSKKEVQKKYINKIKTNVRVLRIFLRNNEKIMQRKEPFPFDVSYNRVGEGQLFKKAVMSCLQTASNLREIVMDETSSLKVTWRTLTQGGFFR